MGEREFYGRRFKISGEVLDPRPETETLIESSLAEPFTRILDLGTGSGCILVTLLAERLTATGLGTDLSESACLQASANAVLHRVQARANIVQSDWFDQVDGQFDLIVSNPPYIALSEMDGLEAEVRDHEPEMALTDGGDGLGALSADHSRRCAASDPGRSVNRRNRPDTGRVGDGADGRSRADRPAGGKRFGRARPGYSGTARINPARCDQIAPIRRKKQQKMGSGPCLNAQDVFTQPRCASPSYFSSRATLKPNSR